MSLLFTGENTSYITVANDDDLKLGTGEFTIEWFQYRTDENSFPRIFQFNTHPNAEFGVSIESNKLYLWANSSWILNANIGEHKNEWIHFAITRDITGRIRVFKNGEIIKTVVYGAAINPTSTLYIGGQENSANNNSSFGGNLTNFRYAKKAYYISNFSRPIAPLLNTQDTSLLLLAHSVMEGLQNYSSKEKVLNIFDTSTNTKSPFSTNVLSLTTNSSKSFLENSPEDPFNPMSPLITKWIDFSYYNTEFKLDNTSLQDDELVFTRANNSVATQLTSQTRSLTNMTVYGWIKVSHTSNVLNQLTIFANEEANNTNIYGIHTTNIGELRIRWNDSFSTTSTNLNIPDDTYVFIALTVDTSSKVAKMYLKYSTINSNYTFSGSAFESDLGISPIELSNLMIGGNSVNNNRYFNGSMKTLQMFNTVLSDAQIQEQYLLSGQQLGYVQYQTITPYKIQLVYNPLNTFSDTFKNIFSDAANIVESMIIQSHGYRENEDYDMKVNINIENLGEDIIGSSVMTRYHIIEHAYKPDIPIEQTITINSNGLDTRLIKKKTLNGKEVPSLLSTFVHEILHGLGIASFTQEELIQSTSDGGYVGNVGWDTYLDTSEVGQSWYVGSHPNDYTRSKAIMAYREITGNPYIQRIPTENSFSEGTKHSHWEEGLTTDEENNQITEHRYYNYTINNKTYGIFHPALPKEIMTGSSNEFNYITKLTAGALEDYGYVIDYNSFYIVDYPSNEIQQPEDPVLVSLTTSQDWTAPQYVNSIEYAMIGGGGGGGGAYNRSGGGGGGAGLYKTGSRRVIQSNPYKVVIGQGGAQTTFTIPSLNEQNGNDGSSTSLGNVVAQGGEGGLASRIQRNQTRGGGVAQSQDTRATSGTGGGGGNGGGGGGGVSGNGGTTTNGGAGAGGAGILNEWNNIVYGIGGSGGKIDDLINPLSANSNTGNGGNGASTKPNSNAQGGAGGSGIVLLRYVRGILNDEILSLNLLQYEPLNEFEEQLDPSEPTQINFVEFINTQFTQNKVPNKQSLNALKRALKSYNDRLNTNKGKVQATPFAELFTQVSSQVDLSTKELLAISSTPFQVTTLNPVELADIRTGNTLLYLMNEPNEVVSISIDGTIYEITITETGLSINSSNYTLDEQFTLGTYKFIVRFIGSVGLQSVLEEPVTPLPRMDTETLTKKILNNRTNQSIFSLMNYSRNRILPQNNFLPTQTASSSDRLRKLKIENHINANHR